jgi:hypothetical protein
MSDFPVPLVNASCEKTWLLVVPTIRDVFPDILVERTGLEGTPWPIFLNRWLEGGPVKSAKSSTFNAPPPVSYLRI